MPTLARPAPAPLPMSSRAAPAPAPTTATARAPAPAPARDSFVTAMRSAQMKQWLSKATPGNRGDSASTLQTLTKERITSVAKAVFSSLWRVDAPQGRGAPSYEYKERVRASGICERAFLQQYDMATPPTGEGGIEVKNKMREQVHSWWNSSAAAADLREENAWGTDGTVAVGKRQKQSVPAAGAAAATQGGQVHEEGLMTEGYGQTEHERADDETLRYGYRDPSIDILRRSYLHVWSTKGQHSAWRGWKEHTVKCQEASIEPLPERTFYNWKKMEQAAFQAAAENDQRLPFLSRPIRHQSQVSGLLYQLKADRALVRSTMPKTEPSLKTKEGRPFQFAPEWYKDLQEMCEDSLDLLGFGPELVLAYATDVYGRKMLLGDEEAAMYTPSLEWAYWFMRNKLGLRLRKIVGAPVSPEVNAVQHIALSLIACSDPLLCFYILY